MAKEKYNPTDSLPPGNIAPLKHQAYRFLLNSDGRGLGLLPLCAHCVMKDRCGDFSDEEGAVCVQAREAQERLLGQLLSLPQIDAEQDLPLVIEYVKDAIFLQIIDRFLTEAGIFLEGADAGYLEWQPILSKRWTCANSMGKLSDRLGLNPLARARLKLEGKLSPMVAKVLELEAGGGDGD